MTTQYQTKYPAVINVKKSSEGAIYQCVLVGFLAQLMSGLSNQQWADFTTADIEPPTLEQLITFFKKRGLLCVV